MPLPKRLKLDGSVTDINDSIRSSNEESWTPDWAKKGKVVLCPNDWCTYNTMHGGISRHEKTCTKNHDEGLRLQLGFMDQYETLKF